MNNFKNAFNAFYYTLVRELKFRGITIRKIQIRRKIAFNGVRARKRRRI